MDEGRTCSRCGITYTPEVVGERGFCCICERDLRMELTLGPRWRGRVRDRESPNTFGRALREGSRRAC